ncbi:hypothetical protein AAFP30_26065 [Gordonia sp. CPCC 205515]|uniref:hypothetical protein n=1 Tax=Gordonia sp. CPCC 205515 TaxID=3140791 RepID=UPI003AF3F505
MQTHPVRFNDQRIDVPIADANDKQAARQAIWREVWTHRLRGKHGAHSGLVEELQVVRTATGPHAIGVISYGYDEVIG